MELIITESQYKFLFTEQSAPVKIGCRDYDKIGTLCSSLSFPKAEADKLITKYKPNADKGASIRIDKLVQTISSMGGKEGKKFAEKSSEEGKKFAEKFSESITISKPQIIKVLTAYYPQSIYACCGLGPKINMSPIILKVCGIIYNQFMKSWNDDFFGRQVVSYLITSDNIKKVQSQAKDIFDTVINEIESTINFYFSDVAYSVNNSVSQMEKTTPKCSKVIITQDKECNPIPKSEWYSPNQKYKNIDVAVLPATTNPSQLTRKTYSPKISAFLNSLV
jgi:hypothetical protein